MSGLYVGLMSGTSLDGVDGVLVDFGAHSGHALQVLAHSHLAFEPELRAALLALNHAGPDELHRGALAGNGLAKAYAMVTQTLLHAAALPGTRVRAIGAHGQTVRHRPGEFDGIGYTLQLGNAALLAELTGIDVVADFRSRDLAAGGQGAPLVPAFHRAMFARAGQRLAVLNLGGIANLTAIDADGRTSGFDCGPANALMDHWCQQQTGQPYDAEGAWAAGGTVSKELLKVLLAEPYFQWAPPKSTGRDRFHPAWLQAALQAEPGFSALSPQDVQATLCELTAVTCAADVRAQATRASELLVCGGGALNRELMRRLQAHLPGVAVASTDTRGLPAVQVEACAFAWLARAHCERRPGNLSSVTGARGARILGALYPGR